jgi:hypothetical protein
MLKLARLQEVWGGEKVGGSGVRERLEFYIGHSAFPEASLT